MRYEKGSFVVIPNKQQLKGCPAEMQSIYFWICEHANEKGQCYPTRKNLAVESGVNIKTLDRYLKLLVAKGVLSIENRVNEITKEKTSNLYQILLTEAVTSTPFGVGLKTGQPRPKNGATPRPKNGAKTVSNINSNYLTENLAVFNSLKKNTGIVKQKLRVDLINNGNLATEEEIEGIMDILYEACETQPKEELQDTLIMFGLK